jgi:hypothetical protein
MPASGNSDGALNRASADLRSRIAADVELLWDDGEPATRDVHKLTVIARDVPLVFPVEHDVLVARGAPYEQFMKTVAAEVAKMMEGKRSAPPSA